MQKPIVQYMDSGIAVGGLQGLKLGFLLYEKSQITEDLWLLNHGMPTHLTNPSFVSTCSDTEGHLSLRDALTFVSDRLP